MIQEKKQMKIMHQENLRAIEAKNRVLNDLQKNQVEIQQILVMTKNGYGSTDSNLQAKLHTILQQNNFLKGELDKLSAQLAKQKQEIHVVKCGSESARGRMKHQAEQLGKREMDVSTLHKEFSRMKIVFFKHTVHAEDETNKKL